MRSELLEERPGVSTVTDKRGGPYKEGSISIPNSEVK